MYDLSHARLPELRAYLVPYTQAHEHAQQQAGVWVSMFRGGYEPPPHVRCEGRAGVVASATLRTRHAIGPKNGWVHRNTCAQGGRHHRAACRRGGEGAEGRLLEGGLDPERVGPRLGGAREREEGGCVAHKVVGQLAVRALVLLANVADAEPRPGPLDDRPRLLLQERLP